MNFKRGDVVQFKIDHYWGEKYHVLSSMENGLMYLITKNKGLIARYPDGLEEHEALNNLFTETDIYMVPVGSLRLSGYDSNQEAQHLLRGDCSET